MSDIISQAPCTPVTFTIRLVTLVLLIEWALKLEGVYK